MFFYSVPIGMSLSDVRPRLWRTTTAFASLPCFSYFLPAKDPFFDKGKKEQERGCDDLQDHDLPVRSEHPKLPRMVSVRGCLLFVSQGVLDGKEAFALLGQNGSSQMPDGMKTERFYPGLGASLFITWAAKTPFTSTIKGVRRIYQKPSWTPTLSGSLTSCTRPRRPTPVLTF